MWKKEKLLITSNFSFSSRVFQPITRQQILDSSKLKKLADDNFKFEENDREQKQVENTVGKGETAH